MNRIAIIGAGAAGTLTAVHLMREQSAGETEVVLIDRNGSFGPGVAYGTREPSHLLNVPALRMGGLAGDPEHFYSWLRARGHQTGPADFIPRGFFGDYLLDLLGEAEAASAGRVRLRRLSADVVALTQPSGPGSPLEVGFSDGPSLSADRAVLAIGPLPAGDPVGMPERMLRSDAYVANPWAPGALEQARGASSVVVIGTGLTMVDVALTLARDGEGPEIHAISRSGLVPRRHREDLTQLHPFPLPLDSGELAPIVAAVLEQIGRAGQRGCDWRDVLDSLRPATPAIWRSLRVSEQRRFLAELQRFWDVHRFRMAPEVADAFDDLLDRGRLSVEAGTILAVEPTQHGARVSVRPAGREAVETIECERVINCTGAGADLVRNATPLVADLIARGMARPDSLSLGLDVAPDGALVDDDGRPSDRVHVVGCLRKGVEWEAIGITEIRDHAAAIAAEAMAPTAGRIAA